MPGQNLHMNKKVVLFGGSFDPPHLGHLLMAQWVSELCQNVVRFLPAGNPPHKNTMAPAQHRREMLAEAIKGNPNFCLDDYELTSKSLNYTYLTLEYFTDRYKLNRDNLLFIVGSDSLNSLQYWRMPGKIAKLCTLVVFEREPIDYDLLNSHGIDLKTIFCDAPKIEISSTLVRERIRRGLNIDYLVPDSVRRYISKTRLYQEGN